MKKIAAIALLAAGALLAQGPRGGGMGMAGFRTEVEGLGVLIHGDPVAGAPFSAVATTVHQQTLANGNSIEHQQQSNLFRDSQGRVREETTWNLPNGQGTRNVVTISDPVAQTMRRLNPQNKTVSETPLRQRPSAGANMRPGARGHVRGDAANLVTEDLGAQTINGLAATGTRLTRTIAAGAMGNSEPIQVVRETWISSDLKIPIMIKTSDPRFGTWVTQITNVSRAEPDAALFQTPAGYTQAARPQWRRGPAQAQ